MTASTENDDRRGIRTGQQAIPASRLLEIVHQVSRYVAVHCRHTRRELRECPECHDRDPYDAIAAGLGAPERDAELTEANRYPGPLGFALRDGTWIQYEAVRLSGPTD